MKHLSKSAFAVFFCLIFFINCSEQVEIEKNRINAKDMEFVGLEHNEILEKTFIILKKEKKEIKIDRKSNSKKNHLKRILTEVISNTEKYSEEAKKNGIKSVEIFFKKEETLSKSINNLKAEYLFLTKKEQFYLKELELILSNIDINNVADNSLLKSIVNLEKTIESDDNLNNDQLLVLFSTTQTAKYSFLYWKDNLNNWIDLSSDKSNHSKSASYLSRDCDCDGPAKFNKAAGEIVSADAAGAVAGAVGAAAVNVVIGPGQAAYGAAIVGTAATSSAFVAATKFFSWLTS